MKRLAVVFVFSALFFGCIVPTIHPIYTEDDLVFDAKLVGVWNVDKGETWTFNKASGATYRLDIEQKGQSGVFVARLVDLDGTRWLDVYPGEIDKDKLPMQASLLMPFHLFARVDRIGDTLNLAIVSAKAMEKLLKENPKALKHEIVDETVVLTADTKALQAFLKAHAHDADLFEKVDPIPRVKQRAQD